MHRAPLVFACDGVARAALTASWYRQMGHDEVYALDSGTSLWAEAGRSLETGLARPEPVFLREARRSVRLVEPDEASDPLEARVIHVGTSQQFADGHPPGAQWEPRGALEVGGNFMAAYEDSPLIVVCEDGRQSLLAAQTVQSMGHREVAVVRGGMVAYREAHLPTEEGLSGVLLAPNDVLAFGPQRGYADMQHYLRWETALGEKYAGD